MSLSFLFFVLFCIIVPAVSTVFGICKLVLDFVKMMHKQSNDLESGIEQSKTVHMSKWLSDPKQIAEGLVSMEMGDLKSLRRDMEGYSIVSEREDRTKATIVFSSGLELIKHLSELLKENISESKQDYYSNVPTNLLSNFPHSTGARKHSMTPLIGKKGNYYKSAKVKGYCI